MSSIKCHQRVSQNAGNQKWLTHSLSEWQGHLLSCQVTAKKFEEKIWPFTIHSSILVVLCNWRLCLVLEATRIILCVCLVLSSLQTRGTSWKSLPFQNLFKDGEEKMFFLFPKGWSWAGHKKGTTFLGSQDKDDRPLAWKCVSVMSSFFQNLCKVCIINSLVFEDLSSQARVKTIYLIR